MRERELIIKGRPCDVNFRDETIQSIADFRAKGKVLCSNLQECQRRSTSENIQCSLKLGGEMAEHILRSGKDFDSAVAQEKQDFMAFCPQHRFWVFRNGNWMVVEGKTNVIDDVTSFALIVIDKKTGEEILPARRPEVPRRRRVPLSVMDHIDDAIDDLD